MTIKLFPAKVCFLVRCVYRREPGEQALPYSPILDASSLV